LNGPSSLKDAKEELIIGRKQRAPNTDYDFFKMLHDRGRRAACRFFDSHFDDIGARGTVNLAQEVQAEWA